MDEESVDAAVGNENIVICASLNHQSVRSWLKKISVRSLIIQEFPRIFFLTFNSAISFIQHYNDISKIFILDNEL